MKKNIKFVNIMLCVTLIVTFLSGVLIHPFQEAMWVILLHKLGSVLFVIGCIIHGVQHCKSRKPERES